MSVQGAATGGSRKAILEALRDRLAVELDGDCEKQSLAALAKEFRAVVAELAALEPAKEKSRLDELAERRAAKSQDGAGVDGKRRTGSR